MATLIRIGMGRSEISDATEDAPHFTFRCPTLVMESIGRAPDWRMAKAVLIWPPMHARCRHVRPYWEKEEAE